MSFYNRQKENLINLYSNNIIKAKKTNNQNAIDLNMKEMDRVDLNTQKINFI